MMGLFNATHRWGEATKDPLPKIRHKYSTMMKLDIYTLPKQVPKKYKSCDTPLEFC